METKFAGKAFEVYFSAQWPLEGCCHGLASVASSPKRAAFCRGTHLIGQAPLPKKLLSRRFWIHLFFATSFPTISNWSHNEKLLVSGVLSFCQWLLEDTFSDCYFWRVCLVPQHRWAMRLSNSQNADIRSGGHHLHREEWVRVPGKNAPVEVASDVLLSLQPLLCSQSGPLSKIHFSWLLQIDFYATKLSFCCRHWQNKLPASSSWSPWQQNSFTLV